MHWLLVFFKSLFVGSVGYPGLKFCTVIKKSPNKIAPSNNGTPRPILSRNSGCVGSAPVRAVIGKLAPLSKPIIRKTKTNRDVVTRVFPRFGSFYFEISMASCDIFLISDWPM